MTDPVQLAPGAEDNGLALMLSELVRQNLQDHPERRALLSHPGGRVAIVAEDTGVAMTLELGDGGLRVHDGIAGLPDVSIRTGSDQIVAMSLVEALPWGLPDPRGANLRQLISSLRRGETQVFGVLGNLPLLTRLSRLLSVHA